MLAHQTSAWLSDHRFAPFLQAKGGVHADAVDLYEWHAQLCGSCLRTVHHFEVLVRNAVDRQLGTGQPDTPLQATWLLDPTVLKGGGIAKVQDVLARLRREGHPPERRRVVAGLSFVFWRDIFTNKYESLWLSSLRHAFPGANLRRDVLKPMTRIHLSRNRLAHHDSLLQQRNDYRYVDMVQVATFIDPEAAEFLKRNSDMLTVLAARP
jgi:hypothetical protein